MAIGSPPITWDLEHNWWNLGAPLGIPLPNLTGFKRDVILCLCYAYQNYQDILIRTYSIFISTILFLLLSHLHDITPPLQRIAFEAPCSCTSIQSIVRFLFNAAPSAVSTLLFGTFSRTFVMWGRHKYSYCGILGFLVHARLKRLYTITCYRTCFGYRFIRNIISARAAGTVQTRYRGLGTKGNCRSRRGF